MTRQLLDRAESHFLYFAFGSNLWSKRIRHQNPSAEFVDIAHIKGYSLQFKAPSKRWAGCAATIVPDGESATTGVVWRLATDNLASLDDQEGVHLGIYERFQAEVGSLTDPAKSYQVYTYRVTDSYQVSDVDLCKPSATYKEVILRGAEEHALPAEYIDKLRRISDNGRHIEIDFDASLC